jgi:RNA polymerase sigma-70 factor (ECF subfamily)
MVRGRADLLSRAQRGDRAALESLCRQEWLTVYRTVAGWVASRQEAEDLTQEVFLRALRHLEGYQSATGSFRPYLVAVARNLVRDRWRSQQRQTAGVYDSGVGEGRDEGPEAALVAAEGRAELIAALAQLPSDYQRVLRLRLIEGQSAAEVAGVLERSPEAVRQLQHRALDALRSGLAREREQGANHD